MSSGGAVQQATLDVRADAFPLDVEVAPRLGARIFLHQVAAPESAVSVGTPHLPGWCWSYASRGLEAFGQREVIFTLPVATTTGDPGRPPTDPLRFFATLLGLASQGRVVHAGGLTALGGAGFMGRPGIAYAPAHPVDGVDVAPGALCMLAITAEEVEVHNAFGQARLLTSLGRASTFYPYPPWSDLRRAAVSSPQTMQGSILAQIPRVTPGAMARMRDGALSLQLRPDAARLMAQVFAQLAPESPYALLTEIDPAADGCLVWQAGQHAPAAIAPSGSAGQSLAGCFVAVVPQQSEEGAQVFEDGFAFFGGQRSIEALRTAISARQRLELGASSGRMPLSLEWPGN